MPALPDNVNPSLFKHGEYIGYDASGRPWRVRKVTKNYWLASPAPSNPALALGVTISRNTLTAVADALASRQAPRVISPF